MILEHLILPQPGGIKLAARAAAALGLVSIGTPVSHRARTMYATDQRDTRQQCQENSEQPDLRLYGIVDGGQLHFDDLGENGGGCNE